MNFSAPRWLFLFISSFFAISAQAFSLRLSESDVNQMVNMAFPQTQVYAGIAVTYQNPKLTFGASDNEVIVDVKLTGSRGAERFRANAQLNGFLTYLGNKGELQIRQPKLNKFDVQENTLGSDKEIRNAIDTVKGKAAPMILLVDFSKLNMAFLGGRLPSRMVIEGNYLVVDF